jgi:hypothetical protein
MVGLNIISESLEVPQSRQLPEPSKSSQEGQFADASVDSHKKYIKSLPLPKSIIIPEAV